MPRSARGERRRCPYDDGMHYLVAIEPASHPAPYGVVVPDLPGCFAAGDTVEEAMANAEEAIAAWLAAALDVGQTIPAPTPVTTLRRRHRSCRHWTWAAVRIDPAALDVTLERVSLRLPRCVLNRLDAQARSVGESRAGYIARLAIEGAAVR